MAEVASLRVRMILDVRRPHADTSTATCDIVWRFLTHFRTAEWPGERLPDLYYDPRSLDENQDKRSSLHAKCVVVDRKVALVTSANFTEAAQQRNLEVGALMRVPDFAARLSAHFDSLIAAGLLERFPGQ